MGHVHARLPFAGHEPLQGGHATKLHRPSGTESDRACLLDYGNRNTVYGAGLTQLNDLRVPS